MSEHSDALAYAESYGEACGLKRGHDEGRVQGWRSALQQAMDDLEGMVQDSTFNVLVELRDQGPPE